MADSQNQQQRFKRLIAGGGVTGAITDVGATLNGCCA